MRKYNLRCNYCGHDHLVNWWWLVVKLITKGDDRAQCERCSRQSRYIFVGHVTHDPDKRERDFNSEVEKAQRRVRSMRGLKVNEF